METVYIAIGSNLGDRSVTLQNAIACIAQLPGTRCAAQSVFLPTAAVGGPPNQPEYLNAAIAIETRLSPRDLLEALLRIEHQFGRDRSTEHRDGPRTLDLDILLFGDRIIREDHLQIPHPRMSQRRFVLDPLAQIAPNVLHPLLHLTITQLRDRAGVTV